MEEEVKECCSMDAYVRGIKFYEGLSEVKRLSMMHVRLVREADIHHDSNAVLAVLKVAQC